MRRAAVLIALVAALPLSAGCGGEGGCLSQAEVEEKVNEIAGGFEFSDSDVDAKQDEIADVRAREC